MQRGPRRARHDGRRRSAARRSTSPSRGRERRMVDLVSRRRRRRGPPVAARSTTLRELADGHGVRWEPSWGAGKIVEELFEATVEAGIVRADVRHRPPGRDLAAGPRRPHRPVADRALRAVHRRRASSPTATASSTTRSSSGCASRTSSGRRTPATSRRGIGRRGLPAGARVRHAARPAGSASASTAS